MQPVESGRGPDQPPGAPGAAGAASPAGPEALVEAPVERLAEFGGDAACWLARVCPDCGLITEGHDANRCASCGQPLPSD